MAVAVVVVVALGVAIVGVFWYGFRGAPNSGPALGNNSPYPTDLSGDAPPYLPGPIITEDEQFRRDAGAQLRALKHRKDQ